MLPHVCSAGARCLWRARAARRHRLLAQRRSSGRQGHADVCRTWHSLGIDLSILSCMVRHMPNQQMQLDRVFRALGDLTRRAVLGRLSAGPAP
jgi:hypothetical protein